MKTYGPSLLFFLFICAIFEIAVQSGTLPEYLFPAPSQVVEALIENPTVFAVAFGQTLRATLSGFLFSALAGSLLALVFSMNQTLRRAILPFFILFQIVPVVAIAPLLVIWFGFGEPTVRASAVLVSIFPVLANTLAGLDLNRRDWTELFQSLQASRWQIFLRLQLPSAVPDFFNGLRLAAGLAVIGAIVGEFIAGNGLGSLIDSARTQQRIDQVFAAIFCSAVLGLLMVTLVDGTRILVNKRRPFENSRTQS